MRKDEPIDFVVLWVDPNDKDWQKSRAKYAKEIGDSKYVDNSEGRYRDWDLFKYWFRGVEKFAPWVNKVHLVTCGHVPKWLNTNHPKLHIVKHSDIMPKDALPTFNSNAIELCVHKIPGLADQFVLFNDDMYITKSVKPTDFFKNGKPVNTMAFFAIRPIARGLSFYQVATRNIAIINDHFNFKEFRKKNLRKCLSLKQREWVIFSYPLLVYNYFTGFRSFHIPISYKKETFEVIWDNEPLAVSRTVHNKFRDNSSDISHWVCNYWQFASGNFCQRSASFGTSKTIIETKVPKLIEKQKRHMLCLNDTDDVADADVLSKKIKRSFEKILPDKSGFEL